MRELTAAGLLSAWETGSSQSLTHRALTLLSLIHPQAPISALASLSIGERDAQLLTLREWLFGPRLSGAATCPTCGEQLELNFDADQIRAPAAQAATSPVGETFSWQADGYDVRYRLPNSLDVLAVAAVVRAGSLDAARSRVLERCVLSLRRQEGGDQAPIADVPDSVLDGLVRRMAEDDPQGDIELALTCPACGHAWPMAFDVTAYLWSEIDDWARRTLGEVHQLASAYGWGEADILAMSADRRRMYRGMLGA